MAKIALFIVWIIPTILSLIAGGWLLKSNYTSVSNFSAQDIPDLSGKVAIVSGANTGIGYQTALELSRNGAEVILATRDVSKAEAAISKIIEELKEEDISPKVQTLPLDLASFKSVKKFVKSFNKLKLRLDILVLNAGIMKSPGKDVVGQDLNYGFETTEEGFEYHIGVNHIGHAILTKLLTKNLKNSSPSRVVSITSSAEGNSYGEGIRLDEWAPIDGERPEAYEDGKAYGQSKLANIMYANELASRLEGTGVSVYAVNPGEFTTDLGRYLDEFKKSSKSTEFAKGPVDVLKNLFTRTTPPAADAALAQLYVATASTDELVNGAYYNPLGEVTESARYSTHTLMRKKLQSELWEKTEWAMKK